MLAAAKPRPRLIQEGLLSLKQEYLRLVQGDGLMKEDDLVLVQQ